MIIITRVLGKGELNPGDAILLDDGRTVFPAIVRDVIQPGENDEEIIISIKNNRYFITSLLSAGKSWVKSCYRIERGKIFSISNSLEQYEIS